MPSGVTGLRSYIPRLAREYATPEAAKAALIANAPQYPVADLEQLWGEFQAQQALAPAEKGKDLRFRPTESELLSQTVRRGAPFMQEVMVIGRNRSGTLITKRIEVGADSLMARWRAIRKAENIAVGTETGEGAPDTELVTVYAGIHIGAYKRNYV
jgi:hypothetical protein